MTETARQRTGRERREADTAAKLALERVESAKRLLEYCRTDYLDAMDAAERAAEADQDAWANARSSARYCVQCGLGDRETSMTRVHAVCDDCIAKNVAKSWGSAADRGSAAAAATEAGS